MLYEVITLAWGEELSGFDCLIEPYAVADVSTREQGILEAFLVDRGDLVTRGQVVARLDSSIEEASVALAEAKARMRSETQERRTVLSYLQREQERLEKLHQNKAASLHDMDKAETVITSYSIHYTKLYDITYCTNKQLVFDYLKDRLVVGRGAGRLRLELQGLHQTSEGKGGRLLVITSYSIHYTKLYDAVDQRELVWIWSRELVNWVRMWVWSWWP